MASEGIKIPCLLWPHPTQNANATMDFLSLGTNNYLQLGVRCPDNLVSDVCGCLAKPIDQAVNATPNAKLRLLLATGIAGTANFQRKIAVQKITIGTTSYDFTAAFGAFVTVASAGAGIPKFLDVAIAGAFASGDHLAFIVRRDGSDAGDGIVGSDFVAAAFFVADTA